jgi:hypothetical protein
MPTFEIVNVFPYLQQIVLMLAIIYNTYLCNHKCSYGLQQILLMLNILDTAHL